MDPLMILKQKIIKTDAVLKLFAETKNQNKVLESKLRAVTEKCNAKEKEVKSLERTLKEYRVRLQNTIIELAEIPQMKLQYDDLSYKYNADLSALQVKYQNVHLELQRYKEPNPYDNKKCDSQVTPTVDVKKQAKTVSQLENKIKQLQKQLKKPNTIKCDCNEELTAQKEKINDMKSIIRKSKAYEYEADHKIEILSNKNLVLKNKIMQLQLENNMLADSCENSGPKEPDKSLNIINDCSSNLSDTEDSIENTLDTIKQQSENSTQNDTKIEQIAKEHEFKINNLFETVKQLQEREEKFMNMLTSMNEKTENCVSQKRKRFRKEHITSNDDNASVCSDFVQEDCQNIVQSDSEIDDDHLTKMLEELTFIPELVSRIDDKKRNCTLISKKRSLRLKSILRKRCRKRPKQLRRANKVASTSDYESISYISPKRRKNNSLQISLSSDFISDSESCLPNSSAESNVDDKEKYVVDFNLETHFKLSDNVSKSDDSGCIISDNSDVLEMKNYRNIKLAKSTEQNALESSKSECDLNYDTQIKSNNLNETTKKILEYVRKNAHFTVIKVDSLNRFVNLNSNSPNISNCDDDKPKSPKRSNSNEDQPIEKRVKVDSSNEELTNLQSESSDLIQKDANFTDNSNEIIPDTTSQLNASNAVDQKSYECQKKELFGSDSESEEETKVFENSKKRNVGSNKTVQKIRNALRRNNGSIYNCSTTLFHNKSSTFVKNESVDTTQKRRKKKVISNASKATENTNALEDKTAHDTSNSNLENCSSMELNDSPTTIEVAKRSSFRRPVCTTRKLTKQTNVKSSNATETITNSLLPENVTGVKQDLVKVDISDNSLETANISSESKVERKCLFKRPVCTTRKRTKEQHDELNLATSITLPKHEKSMESVQNLTHNILNIIAPPSSPDSPQTLLEEESNTPLICNMFTPEEPLGNQGGNNVSCYEDLNKNNQQIIINNNSINIRTPNFITKEIEAKKAKIIPPKNVKVLTKGVAVSALRKLLNCELDEKNVENISNKFLYQTPEHISSMVLQVVASNVKEKPDRKFTPPAPVMTPTQRTLLGFLNRMETLGVDGVLLSFMKLSEQYILHNATLEQIDPISRLYVAVCKQLKQLQRIRLFCCDVVYLIDMFVPFLYTVLSNWFEVIPLECDSNGEPLVKVLVQIILSKPITSLDINMANLKVLLNIHHKYPKEKWNEFELFETLLKQFKEKPSNVTEFAILLLCKRSEASSVHRHIINVVIPQLKDSVNADATKAAILRLSTRIIAQLDGKKHLFILQNIKKVLNEMETKEDL